MNGACVGLTPGNDHTQRDQEDTLYPFRIGSHMKIMMSKVQATEAHSQAIENAAKGRPVRTGQISNN